MAKNYETLHGRDNGKSERKASLRIVGGFVGAAVAGGAALGLSACDTAATASTPGVTTAIETPKPSVTPSPEVPKVPEVTSEQLRIPADLPTEELAKAAIDLLNDWLYADATADVIAATDQATTDAVLIDNVPYQEAIANLAQENAELYASALLVDNWRADPDLVAFHDGAVANNEEAIEIAITRFTRGEPLITREHTYRFEGTYAEPYLGEQDAPEGQRIIAFRMATDFINSEVPTYSAEYYFTFDVSDGTARLAKFMAANRIQVTE